SAAGVVLSWAQSGTVARIATKPNEASAIAHRSLRFILLFHRFLALITLRFRPPKVTCVKLSLSGLFFYDERNWLSNHLPTNARILSPHFYCFDRRNGRLMPPKWFAHRK